MCPSNLPALALLIVSAAGYLWAEGTNAEVSSTWQRTIRYVRILMSTLIVAASIYVGMFANFGCWEVENLQDGRNASAFIAVFYIVARSTVLVLHLAERWLRRRMKRRREVQYILDGTGETLQENRSGR